MFYVEKNGKIVLFHKDYEALATTLRFTPIYADLPILETDKEIIELDGVFVFAEDVQEELVEQRENEFKEQFFEIESYGWFRKAPKGYSSAVEAMSAAFNMVSIVGYLPENTLTFYTEPDFMDEAQCTEEWLVENTYKNDELTTTAFGKLYAKFLESWNKLEHKYSISSNR